MRKLALALLILVVALCGCSASVSTKPVAQTETAAVSLNGEWKSVSDVGGTALMFARIENDAVEVNIVDDDISSLYWKGTFPAPQKDGDSLVVESVADKAALTDALFGSGADSKTFTFKNNQLRFDFTAFGVTRTIKLERQ